MSFVGGTIDFIKVKIFKTRKKMCMCDMRGMYRWNFWGKCRICYRIFAWIPVLFILAVVAWAYYAYVFVLCFTVVQERWIAALYMVLFHGTLFPFLWAYYQVVMRNPGEVPTHFRLSAEACDRMQGMNTVADQNRFLNEIARGLPLITRSFEENVRFCEICAHIKPDRSHHCSVCGTCVLKMDHHCPWVNNCVGYANYKFFILFLFYAFVLCFVVGLTVLPHFIAFWERTGLSDPTSTEPSPGFGSRFNILFLFFVAVMFGISVSILLSYHMHLVSRNRTTLEAFRPPVLSSGQDKHAFDLGCLRNVEQVFGPTKLMWFVPMKTCAGDGVVYPTRAGVRVTTYASMEDGAQNPLHSDSYGGSGDGVGRLDSSRYDTAPLTNGAALDTGLNAVVIDSTVNEDELVDEINALTVEDLNNECSTRLMKWMNYLDVDPTMETELHTFPEVFDLPEQSQLRKDCAEAVEKLGNEDEDKVSVLSDLESILSCYCKQHEIPYSTSNGWLDVILPLISLKASKYELYAMFSSMMERYVPRDCSLKGKPFHLFRLLLLYHEPELCSFLDSKKILPDAYAMQWFRTLFASSTALSVIQNVWDYHFRQEDPFFLFFLALVLLMNQKGAIHDFQGASDGLVDLIVGIPSGVCEDDVEDLCALAHYYSVKTPHSYWNEFRYIFNREIRFPDETALPVELNLAQALCMPVTVKELLTSTLLVRHVGGCSERPRFFVVDCRPADQYNGGHLPTAFHLDADLMLQERNAFALAAQGLLTAQKQAIAANSVAGGEHLCFMGSGREKEDQYVHMVVAYFLQKNCTFVSMLVGGYAALHDDLSENLSGGLKNHNADACIICLSEETTARTKGKRMGSSGAVQTSTSSNMSTLFDKIGSAVKSKSSEVKKQLVDYITNPTGTGSTVDEKVKHVSPRDKIGRMYRGMASVFTIGDDDPDEEGCGVSGDNDDFSAPEIVSISTWIAKPDVVGHFQCHEIKPNGHLYEATLLVTDTHMYILRKSDRDNDEASISVRRALSSVLRITSRKKQPEMITFRYGVREGENFIITDMDRLIIPKVSEATNLIKSKVLECTEGLDAAEAHRGAEARAKSPT
ncbi:unnamed protein product [Notodromas monacha]|uniref:TBC1 domain family member 23 n=1 Tax=Notodromas monacha TaxID=399045 RepID=A0A7R9BE63_9CRUS|nr:unnamed protein product [Notodromas monacha]CAG0913157.1 unnamed protein product [Notodromas monacha]